MRRPGRRPAGRRISPRVRTTTPSSAKAAVPVGGLLVAGLAVLALVLAGLLPHAGTGGTLTSAARRTAVGRDLVCLGGLPAARWRAGEILAGGHAGRGELLANGAPLRAGSAVLRGPVTVHAAANAAAGAWAVEWTAPNASVAASSCASPRAEWWFPGAGAATRHRGVLMLSNPRDGDAIVDVSVLGPKGPIAAPGLRGIRVASGRTVRLDLAKVSAAFGDLAVHVSATRGLVAAALPERFAATVLGPTVRDWVTAQPDAARHTTALGLGGHGSTATLLVANPSEKEAVVAIRLLTDGGVVAPKDRPSLTVPPGRVVAVPFRDAVTARAVGVRLSSQVPISATVRSVQGRDEAYAVTALPFGSAGVVGLPEGAAGAAARVVLAGSGSGSASASVTLTAYDATGRVVGTRQVDVPAGGAATAAVPKGAAAVRLTAPASARIRAAVLLSTAAGLATEAVPAASSDAEVPDVVPLAP